MTSTANRVIKNTGYLYAKMGITMFVSLYTTRLILNSLGASDFGIFNIVGGAIALLGFLNGAMASSVQRFMSYAEGEGDKEKEKSIFNVSLVLHAALALFLCAVLIVAGQFFFDGILKIPADRVFAAKVVYGSLIVSTMLTVVNVPYDAVMNAHENMRYYAIVGIIESLLKLSVAFVCVYTASDKLIVYGVLMAAIPLATLTIMKAYCHSRYSECVISPRRYWSRPLMKEIVSLSGWDLLPTAVSMFTMQGISLILNFFWSVLANAAQGIANQISGQILAFSNQMLKALNPSLTKKAGEHSWAQMTAMSLEGNKFSFLIMSFFAIPFCIETPYILKIWLKEPPEFSVLFCRLILIRLMVSQLTVTFNTALKAKGDIKDYSIMSTLIWLTVIPLSCVLYALGCPVYTVYLVLLLQAVAYLVMSVHHMRVQCGLEVSQFVRATLSPCLKISVSAAIAGTVVATLAKEGFARLVGVLLASCLCFALLAVRIGLTAGERQSLLRSARKLRGRR